MHIFSLKHHRIGRRIVVAVGFSLPMPKSFKAVHVIKGIIIIAPVLFFSVLLNNNFLPFKGQADKNNATATVEPASNVQKPIQPKAVKTKNPPKIPKIKVAKVKKPTAKKVIVSQLTFKTIKGYQPNIVPVKITQTFRGSHKIYIYAAHETLQLSFNKVDLNRYFGPDELTVRVAQVKSPNTVPKRWKKTITVDDDGVINSKSAQGKPQNVTLSMPVRSPGVYLVDITTNDDVFIENITSRQRLMAFDERVYLSEGPAYTKEPFEPILLTTDSTTLAFSADHFTGRQVIEVNNKKYNLYNIRSDQVITNLDGITKVKALKGDAIFRGDGLFALSPAELIPISKSERMVTVASSELDTTDKILAGNF